MGTLLVLDSIMQKEIIRLRKRGFTDTKIAKKLKIHRTKIWIIFHRKRFNAYQRVLQKREKVKAWRRKYNKAYRLTEKSKEYMKNYYKNPRVRIMIRAQVRHQYHRRIQKVFKNCERCLSTK